MGSWNMPDGCYEWMIPGYNDVEGDQEVYCGVHGKFTAVTFDATETAKSLLKTNLEEGWSVDPKKLEKFIKDAIWLAKEVTGPYPVTGTCEFEDLVDGTFSGDKFYWTCPICQSENEAPLPEPDYDNQNDYYDY